MFSLLFSAVGYAAQPSGYHPVVIAGPFMGQNLEVNNENGFTVCNTKGDYEHVWLNLAGVQDFYCISQGLKLGGWDNVNKVSIPKKNVRVRPFGYAGSDKNQLDGISNFAGSETLPMIPRFESLGYKIGESLFGHTYDWRLGVRDWEQQYYPVFKDIIEDAARQNNGSPVVLTGISMAGTYTHAFLSWAKREFGPAWAKQYVHAFAPVGAPFNGAVMGLSAAIDSILGTWVTDGDCPNCDPVRTIPNMFKQNRRRMDGLQDWMKAEAASIGDDILQDVFASFPAIYTIHPRIDHSTNPPTDPEVLTIRNAYAPAQCSTNPSTATVCGAKEDAAGYNFEKGFLGKDECGECYWTYDSCPAGFDRAHDGWTQDLCCKRHQCKPRTYRASELPELYREIGQEQHAQMMEYALTIDTSSDPGVPVHCIYSHNVQTFNKLSLSANRDSKQEKVEANVFTMDDGDQTVDHASLEVCTRWGSTLKSYKVEGVAHSSMLGVEQVIELIVSVATEDQASIDGWEDLRYSDVRPQSITVNPDVLVKRTVASAICESAAQINRKAEYLDPNTNKMTKCTDVDAYCLKTDCGDAAELKKFFKEKTECCSRASAFAFNPTFWELHKTE